MQQASPSRRSERSGRPREETVRGQTASRDTLLQAAAALMVRKETTDVSLSEIAAESGLNAALVKYYFGNKQGLLRALLDEIIGRDLHLMDGLLRKRVSAVEKLRIHMGAILKLIYRFPFYTKLVTLMYQDPVLGPDVAEKISRPVIEAQSAILREGAAVGSLRPVDPMLFYFMVFGACEHLFANRGALRYSFGFEEIDDALFQRYVDMIVNTMLFGLVVGDDTDT